MRRAVALLATVEEWLAMIFIVGIAVVINFQVLCRYIIDDPFIWPEEISRILMVWAAWWGIAAVTRRGEHIRFDMLLLYMPHNLMLAIEGAVDLISGAFFAFLAYQAYYLIGVSSGIEMAATEWPTAVLVWPILFGAAISAMHSGMRIVDRMGLAPSPKAPK